MVRAAAWIWFDKRGRLLAFIYSSEFDETDYDYIQVDWSVIGRRNCLILPTNRQHYILLPGVHSVHTTDLHVSSDNATGCRAAAATDCPVPSRPVVHKAPSLTTPSRLQHALRIHGQRPNWLTKSIYGGATTIPTSVGRLPRRRSHQLHSNKLHQAVATATFSQCASLPHKGRPIFVILALPQIPLWLR